MGKLSKKSKIIIAIGVLFVLFVVFTVGSVMYTERPDFCKSCHIMKPYHKTWKESAHNEINCLECHVEPGLMGHVKGKIDGLVQVVEYVTGRYSERAVADVKDSICLKEGCHDKQELKNKKIITASKVEYIHGDHWKHFENLGKNIKPRCTTCHMGLFSDEHIAVDKNTCFTCHFKNVPESQIASQCRKCHTRVEEVDEHKEYIAEGLQCTECHTTVKTSDAPVLVQMCYFCHSDREKIEKAGNKELMHKAHIPEKTADCINCHELIEHGKD